MATAIKAITTKTVRVLISITFMVLSLLFNSDAWASDGGAFSKGAPLNPQMRI